MHGASQSADIGVYNDVPPESLEPRPTISLFEHWEEGAHLPVALSARDEYHDASEEPVKRENVDGTQSSFKSTGFQGGIGSSSLKECIELLNATVCNSPAPLDSGIGQKTTDPPQNEALVPFTEAEMLRTKHWVPF